MSLRPFDLEAWDEANGPDPSPAGPAPQRGAGGPPWGDRFARQSTEARALAWLAAVPGAVAGQSGSNQALKAAMVGPAFDLSPGDTLALLSAEYNPRCVPEWSEAELAHKVESAFKRETRRGWLLEVDRNPAPAPGGGMPPGKGRPPGGDLPPRDGPPPPADDDEDDEGDGDECERKEGHDDNPHELARIFRAAHYRHADGWRLRYWSGQFHGWREGAYRPIPKGDVRAKIAGSVAAEFARTYEREIVAFAMAPAPDAKPPKPLPVTTGMVANVEQALAGLALLEMDKHPEQPCWIEGEAGWPIAECIPMRNAIVHLPSVAAGEPGTRHPTPRLFAPHVLAYDWDPDAPPPERWLAFLAEVWPNDSDSANALQEWMGLQLVPDTRYQKIAALIGPPGSGKGTIARTMQAMIGAHNYASIRFSMMEDRFCLEPAIGKLSIVIPDGRVSSKADQAAILETLLSVSGEDTLTIPRKHIAAWTGRLMARITLLSNEMPKFNDASVALARRLLVLRFRQNFAGRPDKDIEVRFAAEMPGILRWAIAGWERLRARGHFIQPKSGEGELDTLRELSSPVGTFVEDCLDVGPDLAAPCHDIFRAWVAWCEANGRSQPGDTGILGRNLRSVVPDLETVQRRVGGGKARYYEGVALKPPGEFGDAYAAEKGTGVDAETGYNFEPYGGQF